MKQYKYITFSLKDALEGLYLNCMSVDPKEVVSNHGVRITRDGVVVPPPGWRFMMVANNTWIFEKESDMSDDRAERIRRMKEEAPEDGE